MKLLFSILILSAFNVISAEIMTPLNLQEVKVGGEIGRRIDITITNNLFKLDIEHDFLDPFRKKEGKTVYIGLGKLIDSAVEFAAYTGNKKVIELKQHLINELLKNQEPDGYMGLFPPAKRISTLWDVHEIGYLIWALQHDYNYFNEKRSLDAACKAADYLIQNWSKLTPEWEKEQIVIPHVAFTGLARAMLALHQKTGNVSYLDFVVKTRKLPQWDLDIVIGRRRGIEGHIYAYMARCLTQLELNQISPDKQLRSQTEKAIDFMTKHNGMMITGSCGEYEIWTDDQDGRGDVGETCALAYQMRVYDAWLRITGDPKMGDLMERVMFNGLFASQSPDGRHLRYFAPLEGARQYWETDTYCCPCNYRRIIAELPAMVYYQMQDGIAINLYTPSEANLSVGKDVQMKVRQETTYPNSGTVQIKVDPSKPVKFALRLRIPSWANNARVAVNGQPVGDKIQPGTFFKIRRKWQAGDQVSLDMPMKWRLVKGRQRQAGRVAVMRGPQVFCLNPAQNPAFSELDGSDLGYMALDPKSFRDPIPDNSVRPDGLACRISAWKSGMSLSPKTEYEFTLTEFPDPNGQATYFRLRDYSFAVDDELLKSK